MSRKNNFLLFLKKELSPSPSRITFALKITFCAIIAGSLALYMNLVRHVHFGEWICSTVFAIPAITIGATFDKAIQRLIATFIGCLVGFLISFLVGYNPIFLLITVAINTFVWSYLKMLHPKQEYTFLLGGILCFMTFSGNFFNIPPSHVLFLRTLDTTIGTGIVFLVFLILFPSKNKLPKQIEEMSKHINSKIAHLYSERVNAYLHGGHNSFGIVPSVQSLNIDIINQIVVLKQFEENLPLSKKSLNYNSVNCDKIFTLVNSFPLSHTLEENNLFLEEKTKEKFLNLCKLTESILQSPKNDEIINEGKNIINFLKEEKMAIFKSNEHIKYPVEDSLKSYNFIKISEEIFSYYEHK